MEYLLIVYSKLKLKILKQIIKLNQPIMSNWANKLSPESNPFNRICAK